MKPWRQKLHRSKSTGDRLGGWAVWIIAGVGSLLLLGVLLVPLIRGWEVQETVTVYTSQDKVYAEQLFRQFTAETGVEVRAVYDSEAVKAVGIANRLLAEKSNPQCDVFWNNEEMRTRQLAAEGLFDQHFGWRPFGFRSRRIVVNTNLVSLADAPETFTEFADERWRGKAAMAYPLYGMTATHFMALRDVWGGVRWRNWCRELLANDPMVVDGNSVVVRQVGRGEMAIGMTDIDDIKAGQRSGYPVAAVPITNDALLVPNTVALVAKAPRPENGKKFIEWLMRSDTQQLLVEIGAIEGIDRNAAEAQGLNPNWDFMLENLEVATEELSELFLR